MKFSKYYIIIALIIVAIASFYFFKNKFITNPILDQSTIIQPGSVTLNLANNIDVTLPPQLEVYSGWKENLDIIFKNNNPSKESVEIKFSGLPYTYLNDLTTAYNQTEKKIDLLTVTLTPLETKTIKLTVQTLKVWDNYFTLFLNETEQKINLKVTVKDKTPLFGKDTDICGYDLPFDTLYGPDCGSGSCDGLSNDRECILTAKRSGSKACYPYKFTYNPELEERTANNCQQATQFNSQINRGYAPISWGANMITENSYNWDKADWFIDALSNKFKVEQSVPSGIMAGDSGWTKTCSQCTNPDGSVGFYDLDNAFLTNKFRQYVYDLSARYKDKLNYYEMANEPAAEFYLCNCDLKNVDSFTYIPSNTPDCTATSGPNQPACNGFGFGHNYKQEFADTYGQFLAGTVKIASEEIKKNNPKALVVTGAIDDQPAGLTPTTKFMIAQGILDNDNVAIGIHQYPHNGQQQLWSSQPVNCSYYQKPDNAFWLPEECEKAPILDSYVNPKTGKTISVGQLWQEMDHRYDASPLLKDAQALNVLDKIYFFDSELHAGFSIPSAKYQFSEALAGLRIGVINAHQKFLGTVYVLFNTNDFSAPVFNLMTKFLTGVTPYYQWESKLIDSNYSSVVYKLFTRGQEDILVFWSNDEQLKNVKLNVKDPLTSLNEVEIITFDADQGSVGFINSDKPDSLLSSFDLKPVKQIKVIIVSRQDQAQPYDWLAGIDY